MPVVSDGEMHDGTCSARSMHVVHFDLFLYVMRERNNRLFSENENIRIRQFSSSSGNKGEGPLRHPVRTLSWEESE
jgi:hypothetical protein